MLHVLLLVYFFKLKLELELLFLWEVLHIWSLILSSFYFLNNFIPFYFQIFYVIKSLVLFIVGTFVGIFNGIFVTFFSNIISHFYHSFIHSLVHSLEHSLNQVYYQLFFYLNLILIVDHSLVYSLVLSSWFPNLILFFCFTFIHWLLVHSFSLLFEYYLFLSFSLFYCWHWKVWDPSCYYLCLLKELGNFKLYFNGGIFILHVYHFGSNGNFSSSVSFWFQLIFLKKSNLQ